MSCGSPVALCLLVTLESLFTLSFSSFFFLICAQRRGKKWNWDFFPTEVHGTLKVSCFHFTCTTLSQTRVPPSSKKESDSKQWHVYSSTPMTLTKWPDAVFTSKKKISSLDTDLQLIWSIKWLTCFKGNLSIHFETTRTLGFKVHETFLETVRRLIADSLLTHCHVLTR